VLLVCACMLTLLQTSTCKRMTSHDDVGFCSASGATSLSCAYCQASPAALVVAPPPVVPLLSLDQSIWSRTDGDINFPSVALPCFNCMLFDVDR